VDVSFDNITIDVQALDDLILPSGFDRTQFASWTKPVLSISAGAEPFRAGSTAFSPGSLGEFFDGFAGPRLTAPWHDRRPMSQMCVERCLHIREPAHRRSP